MHPHPLPILDGGLADDAPAAYLRREPALVLAAACPWCPGFVSVPGASHAICPACVARVSDGARR